MGTLEVEDLRMMGKLSLEDKFCKMQMNHVIFISIMKMSKLVENNSKIFISKVADMH